MTVIETGRAADEFCGQSRFKIGSCHFAAALSLQVPKSCTDLASGNYADKQVSLNCLWHIYTISKYYPTCKHILKSTCLLNNYVSLKFSSTSLYIFYFSFICRLILNEPINVTQNHWTCCLNKPTLQHTVQGLHRCTGAEPCKLWTKPRDLLYIFISIFLLFWCFNLRDLLTDLHSQCSRCTVSLDSKTGWWQALAGHTW